ncbi:hypothetical protein RHGRI_030507 [Rhododendron griersonianum]|uniref:Cystatin domain-containing protein n=1 Tax=Rhododendron griersonianum TaxID=479676 RepID=A0AAV6INB1_9ERIC|nr:hypothetical protein RHGRI_030507 [Rhododendron griersonianum]KAG5530158.1 hypothetical protein RHGRI_030507 [Rhododendron griersonianum]
MAKAAYASELPFYQPTGPIVSGPLFVNGLPPSTATANNAAYASELPFYVPTGPIVSGPLFEKASDVLPSTTIANNPPPPINTADPYMFPPEAPSSYSPLGYYGLMFDVDPIVAAYNNMPDHPNKLPKSWLENIEWERKSLVARAQAMGWRASYTSQQQEEEHGEGEEQPTKKPRLCAIPYVQPSPEVPWISVRDFTKEEREFYNKTVFESDGFDCPYVPPEVSIPGILKPVKIGDIPDVELDEYSQIKEQLQGLEDMADLAIKHYNDQNDKSYQFVKVIKANTRWDGGSTNNITFQAKDDTTDSPPRNFQARVAKFMDSTKVLFCRVEQVSKPPRGLWGRDTAAAAM